MGRHDGTLVAALVAVLTSACGRQEGASDTRAAVRLTAEQHGVVLGEMRTMLASLNGVLAGAARSDSIAIRNAATASGVASSADPELEKTLPRRWLQIALRTHEGFDALAASAGGGRDTVVARLGAITATCVTCHAMYRLTVR